MAKMDNNKHGDGNDKKRNKIQCFGCFKKLKEDHTGIVCLNSDHLCTDCSLNYVKNVFDDPSKHIPLKCLSCRNNVIVETFERQLLPNQLQTFILYNMQYDPKFLSKNEIIVSCPFCQYWEINTKDNGRLLFLCKKNHCKKSSCFWCKKQIKNKHDSNPELKVDIDPDSVEDHFECAQLAPAKEIWDRALNDGAIVPCPKCGIGGQKDNACTHMTCVKCQTSFCYLCGKDNDSLDKAIGTLNNNIMGHNVDWKEDNRRCPLYLDNLCEIDKRWPKNDKDSSKNCVAFLHELRTKQLLKDAINKIGNDKFKQLCDKYNIDQNCGFDIRDVMEGDHRLVIRK